MPTIPLTLCLNSIKSTQILQFSVNFQPLCDRIQCFSVKIHEFPTQIPLSIATIHASSAQIQPLFAKSQLLPAQIQQSPAQIQPSM